jgi:hypothetical protein
MTCTGCERRHARQYGSNNRFRPQWIHPRDENGRVADLPVMKCLVCQGRKRGPQERRRERKAAEAARELQAQQPEVIIGLEVGFYALADEMRQWPDEWQVDKHGEGNNPHVYLETYVHGSTFVQLPETSDRCPCGRERRQDHACTYMVDGLSTRDVQ